LLSVIKILNFAVFMTKSIKILFPLLAILLLTASCSQYQKVLKSDDMAKKLEFANLYYEKEQYHKALPLLEELTRFYIGSENADEIMFRYANAEYQMRNLAVASYTFRRLADLYPRSKYAEESMYLYAYVMFRESPSPELEQTATKRAIDAFQLFINRYPQSERVEEANRQIDILRRKLEIKAISNAKLYHKILDFKAATWALQNVINEYPATDQREELEFLILDSHYNLAQKSVEVRKTERYQETVEVYKDFINRYPESRFRNQANQIYENSISQIEKQSQNVQISR
jgi:outer membrane protein assembly factor BamD